MVSFKEICRSLPLCLKSNGFSRRFYVNNSVTFTWTTPWLLREQLRDFYVNNSVTFTWTTPLLLREQLRDFYVNNPVTSCALLIFIRMEKMLGVCFWVLLLRLFPTYTCLRRWECPEKSAYKILTQRNHPKARIQHLEQGDKFEIRNEKCLGLNVLVAVYHSFYERYETSRMPGRGVDPPAHI